MGNIIFILVISDCIIVKKLIHQKILYTLIFFNIFYRNIENQYNQYNLPPDYLEFLCK